MSLDVLYNYRHITVFLLNLHYETNYKETSTPHAVSRLKDKIKEFHKTYVFVLQIKKPIILYIVIVCRKYYIEFLFNEIDISNILQATNLQMTEQQTIFHFWFVLLGFNAAFNNFSHIATVSFNGGARLSTRSELPTLGR